MIRKERVLVRDNKKVFLKMFKRKFKDEFEFSEDSFLLKNEEESKDFDRSIFVIYEKSELIDFLKLDKKGRNVMICFSNKNLLSGLFFLEDIKNLCLVDITKSRTEIFRDLKAYFKNKSDLMPKLPEIAFTNPSITQMQFNSFQKALLYMS